MPQKPIELPPKVAKIFVKYMRAYYAEPGAIKRDKIAGDTAFLLKPYLPPRDRKLRLPDIYRMPRCSSLLAGTGSTVSRIQCLKIHAVSAQLFYNAAADVFRPCLKILTRGFVNHPPDYRTSEIIVSGGMPVAD